jgi:hypothetical protein
MSLVFKYFDPSPSSNKELICGVDICSKRYAYDPEKKTTSKWLQVADNEAVNDKLFDLLHAPFPFLIRIPCAAHTIQLVVRQIMDIKRWKTVLDGVRAILSRFDKSKEDRLELRRLQNGKNEKVLVKPCDTRWNSTLAACVRFLELRAPLIFMVKDLSFSLLSR